MVLKSVLQAMAMASSGNNSNTETSEDTDSTLDEEVNDEEDSDEEDSDKEDGDEEDGEVDDMAKDDGKLQATFATPVSAPANGASSTLLSGSLKLASDMMATSLETANKVDRTVPEEKAKTQTTPENSPAAAEASNDAILPTLSKMQLEDSAEVLDNEKGKQSTEEHEAELAKAAKNKKKRNNKKKNKNNKKEPAIHTRSLSSSDGTISAPAAPNRTANLVLTSRFGFDEFRDELKCRRSGCGKLTNCHDGSTVICPRCGVSSFLRYCSLECLLDPDMVFHRVQECGTCPISQENLALVDQSTLITSPATMRPYIECEAPFDNPSRHRQAVYHSSNSAAGDYFVFNDFHLLRTKSLGHVAVIGRGEIIAVVQIIPDYKEYQGHSIFQEILEDCLRRGYKRADKCLALVDLIKKELVRSGQWSFEVQECLVFQMRNEFAYEVPVWMLDRFGW